MVSNNEFIINDYVDLLGEKNRGYYICPNCENPKLSINKNGKKYTCYSCGDSKAIASKLLSLREPQNNNLSSIVHKNNSSPVVKSPKGIKTLKTEIVTHQQKPFSPNKIELINFLKSEIVDLRFNEIEQEIYVGDKTFKEKFNCSPNYFSYWLAENKNISVSSHICNDSLCYLAQQNSFNPLKEELLSYADNEKLGADYHSICSCYMGVDNPLYDKYIANWILKAVSRIFLPGCYVREVLILKGEEKIGKTQFFSILGGNYFTSSLGDPNSNKDQLLIAHRAWICEWGELDDVFSRKRMGEIKRFITATSDSFRPPYGSQTEVKPRSFILCGTTNEDRFLSDPTGNTRFWIVDLENNKINLDALKENRNHILAQVTRDVLGIIKAGYSDMINNGSIFGLDEDEEKIRSAEIKKYLTCDPFEEKLTQILEILEDSDFVLGRDIWHGLGISDLRDKQKLGTQFRNTMAKLGWKQGKRQLIDGVREYTWIKKT